MTSLCCESCQWRRQSWCECSSNCTSDDDAKRKYIWLHLDRDGRQRWRRPHPMAKPDHEQHEQQTDICPNDHKGRFRSIQLGDLGDRVALNLSLLDQRARSLDPVDLAARPNHEKASCALLSVLWNHKEKNYFYKWIEWKNIGFVENQGRS